MHAPVPATAAEAAASAPPLDAYQKRLLVFLSVASFFEGYDFIALGQILPNLRADMGLSEAAGGRIVGAIGFGAVLSYFLVRLADRWGRARMLTITILGYTLFTFLTGLSRSAWDFMLFQLAARVFLVAEWALAAVFASEEFPAARRGFALAMLQASTTFGSIVGAGVAPLLLMTPFDWRSVYFVGIAPLLMLAWARRGLRESGRFRSVEAGREAGGPGSLFAIFRTRYRGRVLWMAAIWSLTYAATQPAITFFKEYAVNELSWTDGQVGLSVATATVASLPLVLALGTVVDRLGRRRSAMLVYSICTAAVVLAFQLTGFWTLTLLMMLAAFAAVGILTVLNAYTTEIFPTEMRAQAFAWSNNLLGRLGYVVGPVVVGAMAGPLGWGDAVSVMAVCVVAALVIVLAVLPETAGRELEDTAAL
ncbi:MAG TPA: MFS transporter [Longimicrobiales bacterium]|nr:MFS transporter [Longimicrobiales bacterium]